jgi:hypothetical protein
MTKLYYDTLIDLVPSRFGKHDVACPLCGPERRTPANRKRRVLRIWHLEERFATYACARCGERGYARADGVIVPGQVSPAGSQLKPVEVSEDADQRVRIEFALQLWEASCPLRGTLGHTYLKKHRGLRIDELQVNHALRWHPGIRALVSLIRMVEASGKGIHLKSMCGSRALPPLPNR